MISTFNSTKFSQSVDWWNGENYHNHLQSRYQLAQEVLLNQSFKGDENILDMDCGDGEIIKFDCTGKSSFRLVRGIDASSSMIETSRANSRQ